MANGSSLDRLEAKTFTESHRNGDCLIEDCVDSVGHDKAKQKSLFCQIFSVYLKENSSRGNVKPVPVMLGDGQLLDLYQLFFLVKEKGGCDVVSRKGLWDSVIVELGMDIPVLASVKLVYDRYLHGFEGWLGKTFEEKSLKNGNNGCLNSLPLDLEKEFRSLLCSNLKDKDDDFVPLESSNIIKHIDLVNQKSSGYLLDSINLTNKCLDVQQVDGEGNDDDDDKFFGNSLKDYLAASRKRKRESISGMVNWTRHIAKHPFDPVALPLPEPSKWKEYKGGKDLFVQLLRARDVLAVRKNAEPNSGSSSQKVKMHPAMYEDPVGHQGTMKLRCSERLPISPKSRCTCCNSKSCSANGNKLHGSVNMAAKPDGTEKKKSTSKSKSNKKKKLVPSEDDFRVKYVSIGHLFQAEVPQWTDEVYVSDPKWLGTQVWPVKDDSKPSTKTDLVVRGRRGKCSCDFQGSVDCIRFLIAENRMKLKLELGSAFYHWGFDKMGEEVSLRWTVAEEKKFKDAMRLNIPSQNKSFWNNPSKYFLKKTRKDMVSYYFNAYIIQLRSYQNRVTPKTVDSDDDEVEFGSFGDGFGRSSIKHPPMEFMECSENRQCWDYE
ncbi:AT-rich interactive domain-containing protein [Trifolium repens]|nr:AT-rich interactive domain-containing protein [Trifolium repens]